jgi:hypothetical protein
MDISKIITAHNTAYSALPFWQAAGVCFTILVTCTLITKHIEIGNDAICVNVSTKFMKQIIMKSTAIIILLNSCAALNLPEIQNLERTEFEVLRLKPIEEPNDLRIDIIRQTYVQNVNDSTQKTELMPYHPLGFDLGNGLYYDLNKNLSIRIDYLLNLTSGDNFTIKEIINPKKAKGTITYDFNGDTLTMKSDRRDKEYLRYIKSSHGDSITYLNKSRLDYSIIKTDTSIAYRGKRGIMDVIYKSSDNQFYIRQRKRQEIFQITSNEIKLGDYYLIKLSEDNKRLVIARQGKTGTKTFYTIDKSIDKLFIYDDKYRGIEIENKENYINVYINGNFMHRYEKI